MKKFFSMMVAFATLFSLVACGNEEPTPTPTPGGNGEKLEKPVLTIAEQTGSSVTIAWEAVANAASYSVVIGTDISSTEETSVTFEGLGIGSYQIRVKAVAPKGYKDSDFATITVEIEGETEIDWFTQELMLSNDYADQGYTSYNSVFYSWKGYAVTSIKAGVFPAESVASMTNSQIVAELDEVTNAEVIAAVNTAAGFFSAFSGVPASTDVAVAVYVTNEAGQSALVVDTITTDEVVVPEEYKKWIGTYTATSHKRFIYDGTENPASIVDQDETFTITMSYDATNEAILLDGMSTLGMDYPTLAVAEGEYLGALNALSLGTDSNGLIYLWLFYGYIHDVDPATGEWTLNKDGYYMDDIATHIFHMDAQGNITDTLNAVELTDEAGNPTNQVLEVVSTEVFATDQQSLYFLIDAWPASFRAGAFDMVKTSDNVEATPSLAVRNTVNALPTAISVSVLY